LKKQCDELTMQKQAIETKSDINKEYNNDQNIINELKDENAHLKDEVITLRKTVKELEDWNGDCQGLLFNYLLKTIQFVFVFRK